jgi:peptidoglycan/LPS O-acetylase OafA/YrhL
VTRIAQTAMATGSYSSNLWFILKSTDYFGAGVDTNPLLHTWSLAVEEQFYLVWPLLLLLCLKQRKTRAIAAVVLSIVALISFAACIWLTRMYAPIAFFSTPTRTWEFAIGGLAAMLQETQRLRALRHVKFAWLGAVLLLSSACLMRSTSGFPGPMALIPGVGTVLILIAGKYCAMDSGLFGALKHPAMQKIGNLSYSWYLWHWPILVFGRILLPSSGKLGSTLLLAISLCIAWLSYRLVETPIRFSPRLSVVPSSALALGAGLTAAGLLVSGLALAGAHRWEHYPPEMAFLKASSGSAQDDHCATGFRSDALIRCSFGPVDGPVVVLFGDSHAGQWIPALRDLPVPRWHVITLLKSACPSVDVPVYNPHLQREDNNCSRWRQKALDYIRRIRPVAVILCNSSGYVKRPGFEDPYAHVTVSTWQAGMRSTLTNMNTGRRAILVSSLHLVVRFGRQPPSPSLCGEPSAWRLRDCPMCSPSISPIASAAKASADRSCTTWSSTGTAIT